MQELLDALNLIVSSVLNPRQVPEKHIRLSEEGRKALAALICTLHVPKGHILVAPGKPCPYIYFISKGFARIFYYKDGKDLTEAFRSEHNILHSAVSLITQQPDKRGIEMLEASDLLYIDYRLLEKQFEHFPEFERMAHVFNKVAVVLLQKRLDGLLFENAESKYNNLLKMFPGILQRLPLGMIASYLGITQETLSRIRSRRGD
jgi:CRP-like cAMP-binding protein